MLVVAVCLLTGEAAPIRRAAGVLPRELWTVSGSGWGRPASDGTVVYGLTASHEVVALDAETGTVRWRRQTGQTGGSTMGSRVVVAGDVVAAGDYDVVAFDRRTGIRRWTFAPRDGHAAGVYLGQTAHGVIYTGSASGLLHAVDAASGRPRWSARVAVDATVSPPVVDQGLVLATIAAPRRGGLVALDAASGDVRWRYVADTELVPSSGGMAGEPAVAGDLVIAAARDGTLAGVDLRSGRLRWRLPQVDPGDGRTPPVADFRPVATAGTTLVAGSLSGLVVAYDLDSRRERWRRAPLTGSVAFALDVDASTVFVPYLTGHLVALDLGSGLERWRLGNRNGTFRWPPYIAGSRLFVTAFDRGFLAFRHSTSDSGSQRRSAGRGPAERGVE